MAKDPYRYYRVEARELVDGLSRDVLEVERSGSEAETIARMLRMAHTLKGASRVVRRPDVADLAHAIEDVLSPLREATGPVSATVVSELLRLVDAIARLLATLDAPTAGGAPAASQGALPVAAPTSDAVHVDVADLDTVLDVATRASVQLTGLRQQLGELQHAMRLAKVLATPAPGTPPRIRDAGRDLLALLETLERTAATHSDALRAELHEMRDAAQRLRLVPVASLAGTLERATRDAATALGRSVVFTFESRAQRLDAHVLAAMRETLVHVVRNAVAHGIEPPDVRAAAGKTAAGHIDVRVERRGRRIAFSCRDDGRGIDPIAVRRAAVARGVLTEAAADALTADESLRLILRPGVSTSTVVNDVSGRGVGLDVARETAARSGGDIAILSALGRGTTLEIVVAASVSSVAALVVHVDGAVVMLPLDHVHATLRLDAEEIVRSAEHDTILRDGESMPFVPLARVLRRPTTARAKRTWSVVILEVQGERAAFGVDRLLGTDDVVIRPLPGVLDDAPFVAGAALDADGDVVLLLDGRALVDLARTEPGSPAQPQAPALPILVVDDSLTTRMLEQSILESAGYTVDLATSAEEGLARAAERAYRLFVVDVEMPGMNGFDFVARTRADARLGRIPAILVTSRDAPEDRQRGRDVGASAYIAKGEFDQEELLSTIRKLTG